MAKKKKAEAQEPAKAGDVGTIVGGIRALVNHLQARAWWDALADLKAIITEAALGFSVPALASLGGGDPCSDEALECVCKCLAEKCDEIEECEGDEKEVAKLAKAQPAMAGGQIIQMLLPVLAQALQAILAGLLSKKAESEASA